MDVKIILKIIQIKNKWTYQVSLSPLVKNLAGWIHQVYKRKYKQGDRKCETYGIKNKNCKCFSKYTNVKEDL